MLPGMITNSMLVAKCVRDSSVSQSSVAIASNFEQLANMMLPGVKWSNVACLRSVEHELGKAKLDNLISS